MGEAIAAHTKGAVVDEGPLGVQKKVRVPHAMPKRREAIRQQLAQRHGELGLHVRVRGLANEKLNVVRVERSKALLVLLLELHSMPCSAPPPPKETLFSFSFLRLGGDASNLSDYDTEKYISSEA